MKGTVKNRETFLNHLSEKLGRKSPKTDVIKPDWDKKPQWDILNNATSDELVERFKKQCEFIITDVEETTVDQLSTVLQKIIKKYNGKSVITWDDPRFTEYKLDTLLSYDNKEINFHRWNAEQEIENITFAEQADVGITFSDYALAESATVVLESSSKKARSVSLLPTSYVAIIPKSTIIPRFTQVADKFYKDNMDGKQIASCINFISGPSNSGDIEMNLVVGVHGPIQVTYIIVNDK